MNHPQTIICCDPASSVENYFPWNWPLVPKRLGGHWVHNCIPSSVASHWLPSVKMWNRTCLYSLFLTNTPLSQSLSFKRGSWSLTRLISYQQGIKDEVAEQFLELMDILFKKLFDSAIGSVAEMTVSCDLVISAWRVSLSEHFAHFWFFFLTFLKPKNWWMTSACGEK